MTEAPPRYDESFIDPPKSAGVPVAPVQLPQTSPFDPAKDREWVRSVVAQGLGAIVVFIVLAAVVGLFSGWTDLQGVEKLAAVLLSPVLSVFGTVIGFYFGERSGRGSPS